MNRSQRRAAQKNTPRYKRMSQEDKIKSFYRNGITIDDLERNHRIGYEEGWKASQTRHMNLCYAAAVRALKETNQESDLDRCIEFLRVMDHLVCTSLTSDEAIAEALAQTGVEINFAEAFPDDRITEAST